MARATRGRSSAGEINKIYEPEANDDNLTGQRETVVFNYRNPLTQRNEIFEVTVLKRKKESEDQLISRVARAIYGVLGKSSGQTISDIYDDLLDALEGGNYTIYPES